LTKDSSNDDETNTNSRGEVKSPSRTDKNGGTVGAFASHTLINAKLEQLQGKAGTESATWPHSRAHYDAPVNFESIEECKDLNSELTASKVGSELEAHKTKKQEDP